MDRATRDKFTSGTQSDLTSGNACWETAPKVFEKLEKDFGPFDIDLTADPQRHLKPIYFGPGSPYEQDALEALWSNHGKSGYSNPPYGKFVPYILQKAKAQTAFGFSSTFLIPLRVTHAFRHYILKGPESVWFCDKRLCFYENGNPRLSFDKKTQSWKPAAALFDSIIVNYRPGFYLRPRFGVWEVPKHV